MKKCIAFDIDGTLFDTKNGIIAALNEIINIFHGDSITDKLQNQYIGPPIYNSLMKYQKFDETLALKATELYRKIYVDKYIVTSTPYPSLNEVLTELKNHGYSLAIATMKTQEQVDTLLEIFGLSQAFDSIHCASHDGNLHKSDMLTAIKQEINAEQYFMVGDTIGDYLAAVSVDGYEFIYAEYGYGHITGNMTIKYRISSLHSLLELRNL